jgi:hypothetical protein
MGDLIRDTLLINFAQAKDDERRAQVKVKRFADELRFYDQRGADEEVLRAASTPPLPPEFIPVQAMAFEWRVSYSTALKRAQNGHRAAVRRPPGNGRWFFRRSLLTK